MSNLKKDILGSAFRRFLDILISVSILAPLLPILLITYFCVALSSKGPVIFVQDRVGLNGKIFKLFKFRSMVLHDDKEYVQTKRDDNRVTKVGHFIRKTSIDELPQFINVIIGDMSIVGPRPAPIYLHKKYNSQLNGYSQRLSMKPGITGLAQVKGYRGGDDLSHIEKRLQYDLEYINNWNPLLDLKIILLTPFSLLFNKDVY